MTKAGVTRKPRSAAGALTPERIVSAAFDIINVNGVDALTMRAVGEQLGCHHTALFWHFRTRPDLIRAVLSMAMDEMCAVIPTEGPWDERAKTICRGMRRYLLDHPAIVALGAGLGAGYRSRGVAPFIRALIAVAQEAGYEGDETIAVARMLLELVGGYTAAEEAAREIASGQLPPDLVDGRQSLQDIALLVAYANIDPDSVFEAALGGVVEVLRLQTPIMAGGGSAQS